jgi:hypothetical protein
VCSLIQFIDLGRIRELTLINNATACVVDKSAAELVSKMVGLKALRLFWVRGLSDTTACRILKHLCELEELCLCDFDNCTPLLVDSMRINNPCLRKVCFGMDILHFVRFSEESLEFMPDIAYNYEPEQCWLSLAAGLTDLTTIQLHHPERTDFWVEHILHKAKQLTEFTLSNLDQTEGSKETKYNRLFDYSSILKALRHCNRLLCLRFDRTPAYTQKPHSRRGTCCGSSRTTPSSRPS